MEVNTLQIDRIRRYGVFWRTGNIWGAFYLIFLSLEAVYERGMLYTILGDDIFMHYTVSNDNEQGAAGWRIMTTVPDAFLAYREYALAPSPSYSSFSRSASTTYVVSFPVVLVRFLTALQFAQH